MPEPGAAAAPTDWREGIPVEIRTAPALKDIKDVSGLAKSYLEAQTMIGGSIRIPSREAGAEDRKAFKARLLEAGKPFGVLPMPDEGEDDIPIHTALGRPATADKYSLPEGHKPEGDVVKLLTAAHEAGLTNKQFTRLYKKLSDENTTLENARAVEQSKGLGDLKTKWGQAYETRVGAVGKMLGAHGAPVGLKKAYTEGRVDAASVEWLYETLSALGGEGTELGAQGKRTGGALPTPAEALARLDEVEKRISAVNPGDPEYQVLVQRRIDLIEQAYPA